MTIPERLGAFYLGKEYDLKAGQLKDAVVMYDARDLTTHAICVGMTGSGKTGLCLGLLEEAAIDKVPAIMIDPKGDITNLLLTFPDLRPEDFRPWVNVDDARRKDMTVEEYAAKQAETWAKGLADWGQGPERIRLLKESADFVIYTPGSDSGIPVSILSSFAAPKLSWDDEQEALRERISGTVSALLGLVGIEADPVRSREHILLANILEYYWRQGQDVDLAKLITAIQNPPVRQLGVFDVDTFYPQKDRFALAMMLNNIIAAPSFAAWIQGVPLDIDHILYGGDGRPNMSIFYIAHLTDAERMFFVTLLLESLITWMRAQPGTTSLRALLYMDEVFGYFPPLGEPPSKRPLLTLLKQARAFGLGVMLTTQNPADLDYKGLTNAGTWFIGKLQAERDKARLLDGLEGVTASAGGGLNRQQIDQLISGLGNRVFLLHNVNQKGPIIFQTRWAMSYLRGPLTRSQVRELMAPLRPQILGSGKAQPAAAGAPPAAAAAPAVSAVSAAAAPPTLPPDVPQIFLPAQRSAQQAVRELEDRLQVSLEVKERTLRYVPRVLGLATMHFLDAKRNVDERRDVQVLAEPPSGAGLVRWDQAELLSLDERDLMDQPEADARFDEVPASVNSAKKLSALASDLQDHLYRSQTYTLLYNPVLKLYAEPGEDARAFKIRCQQAAREQRDAEVDKLAAKYESQIAKLEERLQRETLELEKDRATHTSRKQQEMLNVGDTVLGMFLGQRRRATSVLSSASQKRQMTEKAKLEIQESEQLIAQLQKQIADLQKEMETAAAEIEARWTAATEQVEEVLVRPRKTDVKVHRVALAWTPFWELAVVDRSGQQRNEVVRAV
ncbi:MAG: hypothetical protein NZ528_03245 [Caldilineales bacterium]|nr:hypothetical protein [Caldilineales bacterium]MDW8318411.1 hypothetical protein [Anaerolineae bacterium]